MSEAKQELKNTTGETEVVVETKAVEEKPKLVNEQVESIGAEVKKPGIEGITVEEVHETEEPAKPVKKITYLNIRIQFRQE